MVMVTHSHKNTTRSSSSRLVVTCIRPLPLRLTTTGCLDWWEHFTSSNNTWYSDHVRPLSRDTFLSSGSYVSAAPVVSATWSWWSSDTWESWVEWERARVGVKHLTHTHLNTRSVFAKCAFRKVNKIVSHCTKNSDFDNNTTFRMITIVIKCDKSYTTLKGFIMFFASNTRRYTFYETISRCLG